MTTLGRLVFYIVFTSLLRRGRRDVKLRDKDVLRMLFAEWGPTCKRHRMSLCREESDLSLPAR